MNKIKQTPELKLVPKLENTVPLGILSYEPVMLWAGTTEQWDTLKADVLRQILWPWVTK